MKVMPGVIGQIGQNVADNLFEIGQSAVKGTVGAVADIAHETVEQISVAPGAATQTINRKRKWPMITKRGEKGGGKKEIPGSGGRTGSVCTEKTVS